MRKVRELYDKVGTATASPSLQWRAQHDVEGKRTGEEGMVWVSEEVQLRCQSSPRSSAMCEGRESGFEMRRGTGMNESTRTRRVSLSC